MVRNKVKQTKDYWSITKYWAKRVSAIIVSIFFIFAVGTFYPNDFTLRHIKIEYENSYLDKLKELDLREPEFQYNNDLQFVRATHKCINYLNFTQPKVFRIPYEMITAQAALESGWGTSRFAVEGNNLFGIRTWNKDMPHMIPHGVKKWRGWGVRIFASKCDSVKEYMRLLNEHPAYEDFRKVRTEMLARDGYLDPLVLVQHIKKFSTTPDYDKRVIFIIKKIRKLEENM
tara:strand:+ start:297 stop:986 length:690 start_codon:yes stop_codon:yes gene_type:complete